MSDVSALKETLGLRGEAGGRGVAGTYRIWLWVFVGVGIVWRIISWVMNPPLWGDEAMLALNLLGHGVFEVNRPLENYQVAPPLFLVMTQILRMAISPSEWVLRILPLAAGIGAILVFMKFARRALDPLAMVVAVALMAVSFDPNKHATEFKPYALDLFFGAAYLMAGWRVLREPARASGFVYFGAMAALAAGFSYPSVLLFGGLHAILLPVVMRKSPMRGCVIYLSGAVAYGGMLWWLQRTVVSSQATGVSEFMHAYWNDGFPPAWPLEFVAWFYRANIRAVFSYPIRGSETMAGILWMLAAAGAWTLVTRRQFALAGLLLMPFAVSVAAACAGIYPYGQDARVQQHLAGCVFALAGVGISGVLSWGRRRIVNGVRGWAPHVVLAALLVAGPMGIAKEARHRTVWAENDLLARRMGQEMGQRIPAECPLFVPQPAREIPPVFAWYVRVNVRSIRDQWPADLAAGATLEKGGGRFCLLDCPAIGEGPSASEGWERSTLLEGSFKHRLLSRRCRIYLFEPRRNFFAGGEKGR